MLYAHINAHINIQKLYAHINIQKLTNLSEIEPAKYILPSFNEQFFQHMTFLVSQIDDE